MNPTRAEVAARIEDARWMATGGESLDGAARRLGLTRGALEVFLRRNDPTCLATLVGRQPRDHNRYVVGAQASIYELTGLGRRRRERKQRQEAAA